MGDGGVITLNSRDGCEARKLRKPKKLLPVEL